MTETPSDTSNHQRLEEMYLHLTPLGAIIPYNICFASDGSLWVASKGGIFKICQQSGSVLFEQRNPFPNKMAPYCQVASFKNSIIHVQTEDKTDLTEFRVFNLDGTVSHESFIDGKIQSLALNENGDVFMTKQPTAGSDEFIIYKSNMEAILGWEELCSAFDYCYQSICVLDSETLVAATSAVPINMYSKQSLQLINTSTGKRISTFSESGKSPGQIYFPRSIQPYEGDMIVLDKTGRLQRFNRNGEYVALCASIDAYLGNGFYINGDEALIACSGIVLDKENKTICDDWLEKIKLDGSTW